MHVLRTTIFILSAALVLGAATATARSSSSGFGAYLVGYFDVEDFEAEVILVNPTPYYLHALVAFFDGDGEALRCESVDLPPNGLEEVDINELLGDSLEEGVVKVVSFGEGEDEGADNVMAGLIGWVAQEFEGDNEINTALAAVPESYLWARRGYEIKKIYQACEVD